MPCPICEKRKPQRFCPARGDSICSVCCGREREVTIDCPSDCPYLIASRAYDFERRKPDWSKMPFRDVKVPRPAEVPRAQLVDVLAFTICQFAREDRRTVDTDVMAALEGLAQTYRTLASGLYYEKPIDHRLQRELGEKLKAALKEFQAHLAQQMAASTVRDSEIRDDLILLAQIAFGYLNGRPKGRAFLDKLRSQFPPEALGKPQSNIVLLP